MPKTENIASFVLRFTQELWRDSAQDAHVRWRGHIQHVQGDEETRFTDLSEALAFIQQNLTQLTFDTFAEEPEMSQEKVIQESFKLWEQFASSYQDMMLNAMQQGIKQSETLTQQIEAATDKTLQTWGIAPTTNQQEVTAELDALKQQIAGLTTRVEQLEASLKGK